MAERGPPARPLPWAAVFGLCALQLGLNLLAAADPNLIEIDPEERYNAGVAWMLLEGNLDQLFAMQYRPFCGGCTADALLAAPLLWALPRVLLVYKIVPAAISALVMGAGLRALSGQSRPAAWAWALLCLLPPRAGLHLSLIAWGNHAEAGALVLLALLALQLGRRPLTAGLLHGLAVWVSFSGAFGLLAAIFVTTLRREGRALARLSAGAALGMLPWLAFGLATGQSPLSTIYGDDDAVPSLGRAPFKLLTLVAPRQLQALLGAPTGAMGLALGLGAALSAALALGLLSRAALRPTAPAPGGVGLRRLGQGVVLSIGAWLGIYLLVRFQIDAPPPPAVAIPGAVRYAAPLYPLLSLAWALSFGALWARHRRAAAALLLPPLLAGLAARAELRPQAGPLRQAAPDWPHTRQQLAYALPMERHLAPRTAEPAALALHAYGAAREQLGQRLRDPRRPPLAPLGLPAALPTAAALEGVGEALAAHSQHEQRPLATLLAEAEDTLLQGIPEMSAEERAAALRAAAAWRLPTAVDPALRGGDQPLSALAALLTPARPTVAAAISWAHGRRRALELAGWHSPRALPLPALDPLPAPLAAAWTTGLGCGLGERWGPDVALDVILGEPGLDSAALAAGQAACAWPGWAQATPPPAGPPRRW